MTALLEATDTWAHNIDRGKINDVVFLDLKKAFDLVDHEIFFKKNWTSKPLWFVIFRGQHTNVFNQWSPL